MIVAIVISAINALLGVPGLLVHPSLPVTLDAGVGIIVSVLIIVLTILPSARASYA